MVLKLKNDKQTLSGKTLPIEEQQKLKRWYAEMLKRKDKEIDELKQTNELLMKTSFKKAAENDNLRTALAELRERMSKKKE